jgi:hypothetical protein
VRIKQEIDEEIVALKALKPVGPWAAKTRETIALQVEALKGAIDTSADEFAELPDHQQDAVFDALRWMEGDSGRRPSDEYGGLIEERRSR